MWVDTRARGPEGVRGSREALLNGGLRREGSLGDHDPEGGRARYAEPLENANSFKLDSNIKIWISWKDARAFLSNPS